MRKTRSKALGRSVAFVTLLAASGLACVNAAPAAQAAGGCRVTDYNIVYKVTSVKKKAIITTATQYGLPAHSAVHAKRWSAHASSYKVSAKLRGGASVGASGVARILAKAEAHVHVELAGYKKATKSSRQKIRVDVNNRSGRNVAFVAYSGYQLYYGAFKKSYCKSVGGVAGTVAWQKGSFKSFANRGTGGVTCGIAPASKIQAAAQRFC